MQIITQTGGCIDAQGRSGIVNTCFETCNEMLAPFHVFNEPRLTNYQIYHAKLAYLLVGHSEFNTSNL